MAIMVYNEWYGEIPRKLNGMLKRYNVSPSDFQTMEVEGLSHDEMVDAILANSPNGMFQVYKWLDSIGKW